MSESWALVAEPIYRVEGPQTIADIERELTEIQNLRPLRLQVPVKPKKWWFGGEAALIQLLITWGRSRPDTTLVTHIEESEEPNTQLKRLVSRPFGFVAVWMARDVTDKVCSRELKVLANQASESTIDLMWFGRKQLISRHPSLFDDEEFEDFEVAVAGDRVFLASVDHHPRWRIPPCYFSTGEVRYHDDFGALALLMAEEATIDFDGSPITPDFRGPLGTILHELFKNTHDWARTDECGVSLLRSVRGILAQGHKWPEEKVAEISEGSPALASYLSRSGFRIHKGKLRFLEFSIFDSGPGLARRWLATHPENAFDPSNPTLEEEYQACVECFVRWNSSTRAGHKGVGLYEVMRTMHRLGAFFRVRTGRLSLYRDFVSHPYSDSSGEPCSLFDWTTGSSSLTAFAPAEGVLYTMLIPVEGRPI